QSVSSRERHGTAGDVDINLTVDGSGVECRTGDYTVVFRFANPIGSVANATVSSSGTGANPRITTKGTGADPHEYVVNLSNVPNAQYTEVTLTGVADSAGNSATSVTRTMGVLLGDVNRDGQVDS